MLELLEKSPIISGVEFPTFLGGNVQILVQYDFSSRAQLIRRRDSLKLRNLRPGPSGNLDRMEPSLSGFRSIAKNVKFMPFSLFHTHRNLDLALTSRPLPTLSYRQRQP